MNTSKLSWIFSSFFAVSALVACTSASEDGIGASEAAQTSDIDHMFKRPDGSFDVWCSNGTTEQAVPAEKILSNQVCGGGPAPAGTSSGSSGSSTTPPPAPASCLSPTAIDATAFLYSPAAPAAPGACSADDLTALNAYFKAHVADPDFTVTKWKTAFSAACGDCAFTDESAAPAAKWAPIVTANDKIAKVNRGGCIEHASGKAECGKAYQQFQDCLADACKTCASQAALQACRRDPNLAAVACKAANDAVVTSCGAAEVGGYETQCKNVQFTFDGAVKKACGAP